MSYTKLCYLHYHFLVNVTLAFQPLDWLYPPPKLRDEFFASAAVTEEKFVEDVVFGFVNWRVFIQMCYNKS